MEIVSKVNIHIKSCFSIQQLGKVTEAHVACVFVVVLVVVVVVAVVNKT